MIPFIIAGVALAAGTAAYHYFSKSDPQPAPTPPISLGSFAIWGRPNAGKSTFIGRLVGRSSPFGQKEATTHRSDLKDVPLLIGTQSFVINEIADMPGTKDRLDDWLALVRKCDHVFYLLDLSQSDRAYHAAVRHDLLATVGALRESETAVKRINIIASHVDQSRFKDEEAAEVGNKLQDDDEFLKLYESVDDLAGYVYAANLLDDNSFKRLLESIVKDRRAL